MGIPPWSWRRCAFFRPANQQGNPAAMVVEQKLHWSQGLMMRMMFAMLDCEPFTSSDHKPIYNVPLPQ